MAEAFRCGLPHHQVLEMLAAQALGRDDPRMAYRFADRRCRISPLPDACCFVLRAEALLGLGERNAALEDLETAIGIAPDDLTANRRLLNWGRAAQKRAAARRLVAHEPDVRHLRPAVALLRRLGDAAIASLRLVGGFIEGWVAWNERGTVTLVIEDGASRIAYRIAPDLQHPLATAAKAAASFRLPQGLATGIATLFLNDRVVGELQLPGGEACAETVRSGADGQAASAEVTVIVPVFGDFEATRDCLASLFAQLDPDGRHAVLLVNDGSPDARIAQLLESYAASGRAALLVNARNLGFIGAVNGALARVAGGDVILLNADTVVPPGFIDRLAEAARSAPDIGTVTPLSNNGEFTSFPVPNRFNEGHDLARVTMIDRIAARVNAGRVVDIPNGIGFCLYITRACLDAVGSLSCHYQRGYLEDVDLCLRARLHGLRNVCATSVFVGHAGSRSFGSGKRSLVVSNLRVLEQKFPSYRSECADFVRADPLKGARIEIERALMSDRSAGVLIVTPSGSAAAIAWARASCLCKEEGLPVLVLELRRGPGLVTASLRDGQEDAPQSLEWRMPAGRTADVVDMIRNLKPDRIELIDADAIPGHIGEAVERIGVPIDLLMTGMPGAGFDSLARMARRILLPDAQAEALARTFDHPGLTILPQPRPPGFPLRRASQAASTVGILALTGCAAEHRSIRDMATLFLHAGRGLDVVVIGQTPDDAALMRAGAFATGPVTPDEIGQIVQRYGFDRIIACPPRPLFGHPLLAGIINGPVPVAFTDWSGGRSEARGCDLALAPSGSAGEVAGRILDWLAGDLAA